MAAVKKGKASEAAKQEAPQAPQEGGSEAEDAKVFADNPGSGAGGSKLQSESAGDGGPAREVEVILATKPQSGLVKSTKLEPNPEVVERVHEAVESLETFSSIGMPLIRFKEAFTMTEGAEEVESFDGVILYTKESNVFYAKRFMPGSKEQPTCFSPDGKKPTTNPPIHPTCHDCPNNQFGSAKEGEGKACKNTRPVFVLTKTEDGFSVIPKVLRIPPTSLTSIRQHIMSLAADYGSYYAVLTRFTSYKKSDAQTHFNIGFKVAARLTPQERADVNFIRQGWMTPMVTGMFGLDVESEDVTAPQAAPAAAAGPETRF